MYIKNIITRLGFIGLLLVNSGSIHTYISTHVKVLKYYLDPIASQSTLKGYGLDLRGAHIGAVTITGGSLANAHGEQCEQTDINKMNGFQICNPTWQTDLTNSKLKGIDFSNSNWTNAILVGVDFTGSSFWNAVFTNANLSKSNLTNVAIHWTNFTGANFTGAIGLDTLQDDAPGGTIFCNATMPDGKICTSGTVWNGIIDCNCPAPDSSTSTTN